MKILLTGYRGFIGQNFLKSLTQYDVILHEWQDPLPNIKKCDWVIHLGALTSTTERDISKILRQNYDFSCWLFDQCGHYDVNLQYASSASVYGKSQSFCETDMPKPESPYAWSKFLFEHYVNNNLFKYPNIIVQGFRYFNVYGEHEDHKLDQASPYHKFLKQALATGEIILFENSDKYLRDFVPVEKVVDIHLKFLMIKRSGVWNLGTGHAKSFQSIAEQISKITKAKIKYIPMPEELSKQYQSYTCADLTKLLSTLHEEGYS